MMNDKYRIFIGSLLFLLVIPLFAKEVGVFGRTYPIAEEDFLQFIQTRLYAMQKNGEWAKRQNGWLESVKEKSMRPSMVTGIKKTTSKKEWLFDPSIMAENDMKDHQGKIFVKAGASFNPLTLVSLRHALLFYDADDEKQVDWVNKINSALKKNTKLILVNGNIKTEERNFQQKIYFD